MRVVTGILIAFLCIVGMTGMTVSLMPDRFDEPVVSLACFIGALGWPFVIGGSIFLAKLEALTLILRRLARVLSRKGICCLGDEGPCYRRCLKECTNHWLFRFGLDPGKNDVHS